MTKARYLFTFLLFSIPLICLISTTLRGFLSSLSFLLTSLHLAFAPPQRLPRVRPNRALRVPVRNTPRLPSTRTLQALPPVVPTLPSPARLLGLLRPVGFFVAGGLCSSLSHVIATPIDVVKTSQQAEEERKLHLFVWYIEFFSVFCFYLGLS